MLLLVFGGTHAEKSEAEAPDLEERFRNAILMIDGVTEADVIITASDGRPVGAAAVCKGGGDAAERRITELLCSGLGLPANKIYVVCN